ncbi:hypothetical protein GCM10010123_27720 [Pilimelia anulata]|uniref:Mycothiol-dependent maleylpyruvate isomerase metal-binding domain-containing protein n=1 Tax=Pilimelia anulata TaxID=53371 RepID=A0A8J3F996_9ACTN|nr:maleylpyruvate isomerase family mycothiol-dependent enzyme [Pilimelia anulata]GGJ96212.1 hypothetical protein GCM10010123_27720 [Pilimelia anulata]
MEALIGAGALRGGLGMEYARLRAAAEAAPPDTPVPTCPQWSLADLVSHVAEVYLHKAACIRAGAGPEPDPPGPGPEPAPAVELLDRAYAELCAEFDARGLHDPAASWYPRDPTVGFWIRRMAHETVIHRLDAALAAGAPLPPVPTPLAVDGIDEVLRVFLQFGTQEYGRMFGPELTEADGRTVLVQTAGRGWAVRLTPTGVAVTEADADTAAGATLSGEPYDVLRWLWRRGGAPERGGDAALTDRLEALLGTATQ